MTQAATGMKNAVLADGGRIPFLRSGTAYKNLNAYDLARMVISGLISRNAIAPASLDRVILGNVIQEIKTSNVARDAALGAGIPDHVPAYTVTMACISSNMAISNAADLIRTGQAQAILAGGTETMSDLPIRYNKRFRQKLLEARKYKKPTDYLKFFKGLRFRDLLPELPAIAEFSTGETMGQSCDRLAAHFDISRDEQDRYALRSHQKAAEAAGQGKLDRELLPATVPPGHEVFSRDNGVREDSSLEQLGKLKPAFVKPHGTLTAGNSTFLSDGASATLILEEEYAASLNITPKAYIRDYLFVAQDPGEQLLLGPAYATPKLLDRAGLSLDDMDVFEFHEAFAGQILAVLKALKSETFAGQHLKRDKAVGEVPMDKFNLWGGSLSLGHPFGATGARLVTTAANRLHAENGKYALVAACAAGGQGYAMLLENYTA